MKVRAREQVAAAGERRTARRHEATMAGSNLLCTATLLLIVRQACGQVVHAENVTVMEGETAEITCRLHSYDGSIVVIQNPNRQTLFFNGTRALKDDRFRLVSFTSQQVRVALSDARVEDEGGYYCQLYTEDTHHQVAVLTVLVPPKPVVEVLGEQAREKSEVELQCTVPRSKPSTRIRWFREKKQLQGVSRQEQLGKVFTVTSVVKFPVLRKDDGAMVTCEADVPGVKGMKRRVEFPLSVRYAPTVKVEAPPVILREGEDLLLTCAMTGNPLPPEVIWSRLNSSLPDRAETQGNTLTVRQLSSADNGTYVCEVRTEMGSSTDQYTLVVYDLEISSSAPSTLPAMDQSAVVESRTSSSYTIVGGVLAVLVFVVICVLIVTIWFSVRQKGSYLTHEASRLDEHGEVCEAFINGNDSHDQKKEYFI